MSDNRESLITTPRAALPYPYAVSFEVTGCRHAGEDIEPVIDPEAAEFWTVYARSLDSEGLPLAGALFDCVGADDAYYAAAALAMTHQVPFAGLHLTRPPADWDSIQQASGFIPFV